MDTYRNRDSDKNFQPDRISSYFKSEWPVLTVVTVTGLFYNVLITAQAYFEGQLAQMLLDIIGGSKALADMVRLALIFVLAILLIQLARCLKRYFVRVFANNINRRMKGVLYGNLLDSPAGAHEESDIGGIMTKAISDVDACTEGMRKFTTEVFDTGVAMISYCAMLFYYDWKLALISCAFPPLAYLAAYSLRKRVSLRAAQYKEASGRLNGETLDRVSGAVDYRILGAEDARDASYEERLADYEKAGVRSGVLETSLQPVYRLISTISVIFIVIMGASNVAGTGTAAWNIASFTTFLSCFLNLAEKSSKAAKLFNSVQKAKVSWERIRGLLKKRTPCKETVKSLPAPVDVKNLTLSYGDKAILDGVFFSAAPGEVIGVTGEIASGKSTLGKAFLCESPYEGSIEIGGRELSSIPEEERCGIVGYMGHNPEILSDTVKDNVMLGTEGTCREYLGDACIAGEIDAMPEKELTVLEAGGSEISGGQRARVAIARMLAHPKPLMIFDDPFSALDRGTEKECMENLRRRQDGSIYMIISHRLWMFPSFDRIVFLENGRAVVGTHDELMRSCPGYRMLYEKQTGGAA